MYMQATTCEAVFSTAIQVVVTKYMPRHAGYIYDTNGLSVCNATSIYIYTADFAGQVAKPYH